MEKVCITASDDDASVWKRAIITKVLRGTATVELKNFYYFAKENYFSIQKLINFPFELFNCIPMSLLTYMMM